MGRKTNWLQNGKGNKFFSYLFCYGIFFGILIGIAYYYADRFRKYFSWLLENDYINDTQCALLNQSTDLGMIIITPNIVMISFSAFLLIVFIQNKMLTLFLPKKQVLDKVISFNAAIEKLNINSTEEAINFILNNKIKVYLVDEPFKKNEDIRENCLGRFIYYVIESTYFNKGKLEQYIGKDVLCFNYTDFIKYYDELDSYKKEILNKAVEENSKTYENKISNLIRENNQTILSMKEGYEKQLQDMQDTINKKDKQLQEEIISREDYKNKFIDSELKNKELSAKIQEIQSKELSNINRHIQRSSYYFFMSITNQELQEKNSDKTFTNKEIKDYFWNIINRHNEHFPKLKKEMKQLLKQDTTDEQNLYKFPRWAEDYIKSIVEQRQTKGGRPRNNS